jgi:hypothetical protein
MGPTAWNSQDVAFRPPISDWFEQPYANRLSVKPHNFGPTDEMTGTINTDNFIAAKKVMVVISPDRQNLITAFQALFELDLIEYIHTGVLTDFIRQFELQRYRAADY